jgi:hypothetical protein
MTEATGGRRYYNCQWAQEDEETLYSLINNNNMWGLGGFSNALTYWSLTS